MEQKKGTTMDLATRFLIVAYSIIAFVLAAGLALDWWLWSTGRPTITQKWRDNPVWFYAPATALQTLLAILSLHVRGR